MLYIGPFFQQFNQNGNHLNPEHFDSFNQQADIIAIDFYNHCYDSHSITITKLLDKCNHLYVYISEPTLNNTTFPEFLKRNDHEKITFFSDAVLNFELTRSKYFPVICWFVDSTNYYSDSIWAKKLLSQLTYNYDKSHKFDCLLGRSRPHRDLINSLYSDSRFKEQIIYSYYGEDLKLGLWDNDFNPASKGHELTCERFKLNGEDIRISAMLPVDIYNTSYYSIVAETTADNEYSHFTEKVAKPIVALRPFVAFCGQHYLKNLKRLGFQTFSDVIDETYDSIADIDQRFKLAWNQVEYLCQQEPQQILEKLFPILEYNKKHFLSNDWVKPARDINQ